MDQGLEIKVIFLISILFLSAYTLAQFTSASDVVSITTIPVCSNIFGSGTENTAKLCGTSTDTETSIIRLNINVGSSVEGASTIELKAFPSSGTTTDGDIPGNPCDTTSLGDDCTALGETMTIEWSTGDIAAGYMLDKIVDNVPLAYILYYSPFFVGDDDEDIGWYSDDGDNVCKFDDKQYQTQCPFGAQGIFVRGMNTTTCTNLETSSVTSCSPIDNSNCNCGDQYVETFLNCGGTLEECGGVPPSTNAANGQTLAGIELQCSCFPYRLSTTNDKNDPVQGNWKELKSPGMHNCNANNLLDEGCAGINNYILSPTSQSDQISSGVGGSGGPMNFPNSVSAACRHMVNVIKQDNNTFTQKFLSNQAPFVKINQNSVCSTYSYAKNSNGGCGAPWHNNAQDCLQFVGDYGECYYRSGDTPRFNYFIHFDYCMNGKNPSNDLYENGYCSAGNSFGDGASCLYQARWGANWPLSGTATAVGGLNGENGQYPTTQTCTVCRADYADSSYMAGMWGNQRKGKRLIEDWRDSYIGAYENANFIPSDNEIPNLSGNSVLNGTLGFNYYQITNPQTGEKQIFVLQPVWSSQILRSCSPGDSGDTCWSSFNKPTDFFTSGNDNAANPTIQTEGFIQPQGGYNKNTGYTQRGLATTPFWQNPADDENNNGHLYRCSNGCDPSVADTVASTYTGFLTQKDPRTLAVAKGFTGLGPFCTAYAVSRQAKVITSITFTIRYTNSSGLPDSRTITLSTDDIGTGDSVAYADAGNGVTARINNVNSPSDESAPVLGGVLVVCGTTANVNNVGVGSIYGQLNSEVSSFTHNPWNDLIWLIQQVEVYYPGITGYKSNGCPVPIPSFITVLQCFSTGSACAAPYDLCMAVYDTCQNHVNGQCADRNIIPMQINLYSDTYKVINPNNPSDTQTCNIPKISEPKGVSWYWLEPKNLGGFGSKCGQYGMNPWTFGKDPATEQYICQQPYSEKSGVPCVPGISENTDIPSPCQVVGSLANFHGQTSQEAIDWYGYPASNDAELSQKQGVCLTSNQVNYLQTFSASNPEQSPKAGCSNDASGFTQFSSNANRPVIGLPTSWTVTNPQYWVSQGYLMSSETTLSSLTLDVSLYVNGYAMNADIENVSPGSFVNAGGSCDLDQNGNGGANLTVTNTGSLTSAYTVFLINCSDPSGVMTNPITLVNTPTSVSVPSISPGDFETIEYPIDISALGTVQAIRCYFYLTPNVVPSLPLSNLTMNCNVNGFLQQVSIGQSGVDGSELNGPPPNTGCDGGSVGFGCWLINGGFLSHFVFYSILAIAVIFIITVGVSLTKYVFFYNANNVSTNEAQKQKVRLLEIKKTIDRKEESERFKTEEEIRRSRLKNNVPQIAQAFKEAFNTPK